MIAGTIYVALDLLGLALMLISLLRMNSALRRSAGMTDREMMVMALQSASLMVSGFGLFCLVAGLVSRAGGWLSGLGLLAVVWIVLTIGKYRALRFSRRGFHRIQRVIDSSPEGKHLVQRIYRGRFGRILRWLSGTP